MAFCGSQRPCVIILWIFFALVSTATIAATTVTKATTASTATTATTATTVVPCGGVSGQNHSLTLIWFPYPRFTQIKFSSKKTALTLDDLDGFSADLLAEFVKTYCLNVTLKCIEWTDFNRVQNEVGRRTVDQENIAFMNLNVASEFLTKHFQLSQVVVVFPGTIFRLEKDNNFDSHGGPIILTFLFFALTLIFIGLFFLFIIIQLEKWLDPSASASEVEMSDVFWNFLLVPFGQSGSVLTETPSRKLLLFTWILVWFWFITALSANFSSTLTVHKLQKGPHTFKDILDNDEKFFMYPFLKSEHEQKIIRDLKFKSDRLLETDNILAQFEKDYFIERGHSQILTRLLLEDYSYLSSRTESVAIRKQLSKDQIKNKLHMEDDSSVHFLCLHAFKLSNSDILAWFNSFLQKKKSDGTLEMLYEKWFGGDNFSKGTSKTASIFENSTLHNLCYISLIGSVSALVLCIFTAYRQMRRVSTI